MSESKKKRVTKKEIKYGYYSTFPTILRELLADYKQDDLATFAGVSRQSVAQWKDGKTKPDIYYLEKIADFFNVSTDYLLGRAKEKTTNEDIKTVIETTGLSENAINSIVEYKEWAKTKYKKEPVLFNMESLYKPLCSKALDNLLSNDAFYLVLANMGEYINSFEELEQARGDYKKVDMDAQRQIINYVKPLALFKAQQRFIQILENIGSEYENKLKEQRKNWLNENNKDGGKE